MLGSRNVPDAKKNKGKITRSRFLPSRAHACISNVGCGEGDAGIANQRRWMSASARSANWCSVDRASPQRNHDPGQRRIEIFNEAIDQAHTPGESTGCPWSPIAFQSRAQPVHTIFLVAALTTSMPATQAWSTTTSLMMQGGICSTLRPDEIDLTPPSAYGYTMCKGQLERSPKKRRNGNSALWETSSMAQSSQVYGDRSLE